MSCLRSVAAAANISGQFDRKTMGTYLRSDFPIWVSGSRTVREMLHSQEDSSAAQTICCLTSPQNREISLYSRKKEPKTPPTDRISQLSNLS